MKNTSRLLTTLIIVGCITSLILLVNADFFHTYNLQDFNNAITPIATVLAFIVYFATLVEIRKSNTKNIDFQKITFFKERIDNLKQRLENSYIDIPYGFQERLKLEEKISSNFFSSSVSSHSWWYDAQNQGWSIWHSWT